MLVLYEVTLLYCNPYCIVNTSEFSGKRYLDLRCSNVRFGNNRWPDETVLEPIVDISIGHGLNMVISTLGKATTYTAHPLELAEAFGSTDEYLANGRIMIYDGRKSVIWYNNNFSKLI